MIYYCELPDLGGDTILKTLLNHINVHKFDNRTAELTSTYIFQISSNRTELNFLLWMN